MDQAGLVIGIVGPKKDDQMRATTGIATLHNLEAITSEAELDFKIQNCQKQFGQFDTLRKIRQGQ